MEEKILPLGVNAEGAEKAVGAEQAQTENLSENKRESERQQITNGVTGEKAQLATSNENNNRATEKGAVQTEDAQTLGEQPEGQTPNKEEEANTPEQQEKPQPGTKQWYDNDRRAFTQQYSSGKLDELLNDSAFLDYAEGKAGSVPLAEIYDGYTSLKNRLQEEATLKAEQNFAAREAKAKASPGSLTQIAAEADCGMYSLEELRRMTPEFIENNWDRVQRSVKNLTKTK